MASLFRFFVSIAVVLVLTTACAQQASMRPAESPPETTGASEGTDERMSVGEYMDKEKERERLAREGEMVAESALQTIHFDFDRSFIRDDAKATLKQNAEWLKGHPDVVIQIEGHCDERGTNQYNLALGQRRADSTKNYLVSLGVNGDRMLTITYGEEKPVDPGNNETAWSKNRRAEFVTVQSQTG